jgi:hypothetical protein
MSLPMSLPRADTRPLLIGIKMRRNKRNILDRFHRSPGASA